MKSLGENCVVFMLYTFLRVISSFGSIGAALKVTNSQRNPRNAYLCHVFWTCVTPCTSSVMVTLGVLVCSQQHINVILNCVHAAGHREGRMSMDAHSQQHTSHTMQTPLMENASILEQTGENGAASANDASKT